MLSPSVHQWLSLVAIIWLQSINGTNSNFPSYSSEFKNLLSLSQLHLNNLAFASDTGKFFGFVSGIAVIYLPFWSVLLLGSLLGLIGYGFQFLFLTYDIPCLSYTHMFILSVLAGNSICWINTVCYVIAIKNFPFDRHVAIGLTSSYFGLSAKIYTTIVDALFSSTDLGKAKAYLFLNSVLPLLISILVIPIIRDVKVDGLTKSTKCGFVSMFFITISTGVYAVISSLVKMRRLVNLVGMALFLLAPWLVPLFFGLCMEKERIKGSDEAGVVDTKGVKEEIGVTLMVKRIDFWLYFSVYLLGASLGLVFLNNLGQIAESRGCPDTSSLVSLSSSFGFFGRLVPSLMDYCFSRYVLSMMLLKGGNVGRVERVDPNVTPSNPGSLLGLSWYREFKVGG